MRLLLNKWALMSLLAFSVLQLSACGFHLKGTGELGVTMQEVRLQSNPSTHQILYQTVQRTFQRAGMQQDNTQAAYVVSLGATQYKASRTSTSSIGEVTSQLLKMSQRFEVTDNATGKSLMIDTLTVLRDRQINTADILASENELRDIQQSMREDLAVQIMQRVERLLINQQGKNAS